MPRIWRKFLPKRLRWRLQERGLNRDYAEKIKKATTENKPNDVQFVKHGLHTELRLIDEWRRLLQQGKLLRKARRHGIPVPSKSYEKLDEEGSDDNWNLGLEGDYFLNDKAAHNLRHEIISYQRERRDLYLPWITALTGLLGAAAAVLSLLYAWSQKP